MATEFKLPELGEGVDEADVSQLYVSEGDTLEANQNVMELETEKAVTDLPCPHAGKVTKLHISEGDTVKVGQTLLTIEEVEAEKEGAEEAAREEEKAEAPPQEEKKEEPAAEEEKERRPAAEKETAEKERRREREREAEPAAERRVPQEEEEAVAARSKGDGRPRVPPPAGPATRRLARKLEVDLEQLRPPEGERIRQEDVVRVYVENQKREALSGVSRQPLPDFTRFGPVERQSLNKIAQTSAKRLTAAWQSVPHVTQHGLADITQLESARREHLRSAPEGAPKITLTSIAIKSVIGLLKESPRFNSSLDMDSGELITKGYYHIGVAVDTDRGLLVPVIRDADRMSIQRIAAELVELADRARRRELTTEDMEGGSFTISNQGGIGGGEFTPIVNWPEVAILGMARGRPEVRMIDGRPQERLVLPLSLSYDHRVINGADAARFIERLEEILSDAFTLLIAT